MFRLSLILSLIVPSVCLADIKFGTLPSSKTSAMSAGESAPTPFSEIVRVIKLLPKPKVAFVEFGCGSGARWCIVAAENWGCRAIGIEIDPDRASAAKRRVQEAGLAHLITIIEGDAITTDVKADVGVAYLYADMLERLKPQIEKLSIFASYIHEPKGIKTVKNGDSWIFTKPAEPARAAVAVWDGQTYTHPVCDNPGCPMCNGPVGIRAQLAANRQAATVAQQSASPKSSAAAAQPEAPKGHWEVQTQQCNGRRCRKVNVNVWVPDP